MKAEVLFCFMITYLVVLSKGQNRCGSKCSPAQICKDGKCVCIPFRCRILCKYGFKRDENGCEYPCTCAEEGEICTPIRCFILCKFGFKRDENGCEYPCTCAAEGENPLQKRCGKKYCTGAQICEKGKCVCSEIRCAISCPFGFEVDENGCEYPCTCAEGPPIF